MIAHPNQIVGTVSFTNANPAVLAVLNKPTDTPPGLDRGLHSIHLGADSLPPQSPTLHHSTQASASQRLRQAYVFTVESGPAGAGIAYRVSVTGALSPSLASSHYYFLTRDSAPVEEEPAPDVLLDIDECAGVIRMRFQDRSGGVLLPAGGRAAVYRESPPGSGSFTSLQSDHPLAGGAAESLLVARGDGQRVRLEVTVQIGSDPYLDRVTFQKEYHVTVPCDDFADVVVTLEAVDPGNPDPDPFFGSIAGELDMIGESEHRLAAPKLSEMAAREGPWDNYRLGWLDRVPSSGAFLLPNVVTSGVVAPPQPYQVQGTMAFGLGERFHLFRTPRFDALVAGGATTDLGGTFVLEPGRVLGDVYLLGPPPDPVLGSPLEDIARASDLDADRDGIPDPPAWWGTGARLYHSFIAADGVDVVAPGATLSAEDGQAQALFAGGYDAQQEAFVGDHVTVLGGLRREPSYWRMERIGISFEDSATPSEPESFQDCMPFIEDQLEAARLIVPGSTQVRDYRYCFGQVRLRVHSTAGTFREPMVSSSGGGLQGLDFELRPADHQVWFSTCRGTPRTVSGTDGLAVLTLPEGSYSLRTQIRADNPGGGSSTVQLNPVSVNLPCRGVIDEWIDLQIGLEDVPRCVSSASLPVAGSLLGGPIDSVYYQVNGGAAVTVCSSCGTSPAFSFDAPLVAGLNTVQVTGVAADGRMATASVLVTLGPLPGDYGNVLRAVKVAFGADARFAWAAAANAFATRLGRDDEERYLAPREVALVPLPASEALDAGAVTRVSEPLYFYRVQGTNCAGESGP